MGINDSESTSISSSSITLSCWRAGILWGVSRGAGVVCIRRIGLGCRTCMHSSMGGKVSVSVFVWFSSVYAQAHATDGIVWPPGKVCIQFEKPGITS